jgi:hypothetical protein
MGQLLWGTLYGGWNEAEWLRSGLPTLRQQSPRDRAPGGGAPVFDKRSLDIVFGRGRDAFKKA